MTTTTRWIAAGVAPLLLAGALVGCSDPGPQAEDAAAHFAAALTDHDISHIAFTEIAGTDAQAHMTSVFKALGDTGLTAKVGKVTVSDSGSTEGERATASIDYTWQVTPERPWTYSTDVTLDLVKPDGDGEPEWKVDWAPDMLVPDLQPNERLQSDRLQPTRADILGQGGAVIVTNRPVYHAGIDKTRIDAGQWDGQARALAGAVGIDPQAYAQKIAGAGAKAFVEAITLRAEDPLLKGTAISDIPGATAVQDESPLAPTRDFARPILGRAGDATAEIADQSGGAIVAGDTVGLSGLQRQYDAQLRGLPGIAISKVLHTDNGGDGKPTELFRVDAVSGTPLATSLDVGLQERAESLLADVATPAAIVAIRPSTGDVLVAASGAAAKGQSTATTGQYAPGSTVKVATALAAMRTGVTPDQTVSCTPDITVNGRTFSNVPGYSASALGQVPFRTAFANSCNTAMISLAGTVSQQALHDAAGDLGLGAASPLGAPGYFGDVPTDATDVEHAASMIGQGKVQASPLSMATVAASVHQGARIAPVLVYPAQTAASAPASASASASESATATASASAEPPAPSKLTAAEADTLRSLMRSVVTDGSASVLKDLGSDVGAKTGTAQYGDGQQAHAWMIAFDGDLAVSVFLETGESGAKSAGPIMHAFLAG